MQSPQLLRPSIKGYYAWSLPLLKSPHAFLFLVVVNVWGYLHGLQMWWSVAGYGTAALLSVALILPYKARVRVKITGDTLEWQGIIRRGVLRRRDIDHTLFGFFYRSAPPADPRIIALDSDGTVLFSLKMDFWDKKSVHALTEYFGIRDIELWPVYSKREIRHKYPHVFERHVWGRG